MQGVETAFACERCGVIVDVTAPHVAHETLVKLKEILADAKKERTHDL